MPLLRIPDETGDTRIPWETDEELTFLSKCNMVSGTGSIYDIYR